MIMMFQNALKNVLEALCDDLYSKAIAEVNNIAKLSLAENLDENYNIKQVLASANVLVYCKNHQKNGWDRSNTSDLDSKQIEDLLSKETKLEN